MVKKLFTSLVNLVCKYILTLIEQNRVHQCFRSCWKTKFLTVHPTIRGMIKKFSDPCTSGYQGMKIWPKLFNIISLQGKALSLSVRAFLSLQNRRPFPGPPSTCLYDAFIASILCTTKMGFQFWERIQVRRSHIMRIWGMRKGFKSTFSCSSYGNLWRLGRGIVLQEQNTRGQFSSPLSCNFLGYRPQFACIICTVYRATLLKIINHDHPMTILKDWGHHLSCWMKPLKFLRRGWASVFQLFALHFWFWVKEVNPFLTWVKLPGSSS